jgi:hypothetical protein
LGHWISFGVTLAMMIGLSIYIAWGAKRRSGTRWQKWGPTYLTVIAGFLIMADLTRHILEDVGAWPEHMGYHYLWGSGEYRDDCPEETMHCLSLMGVLFTIVATYLGFALLVWGTMWNANIIDKLKEIRQEWKRLRGMM